MGNQKIDGQIWQQYRQTLYAFILKRVGEPAIAEDIVQDTLTKAYINLKTLKNNGKILPWLFRITRNSIIDHYRKHRPGVEFDERKMPIIDEHETRPELEMSQCLEPMVNGLPAIYQQAITMVEFDGLSQKEVASRQGLSVSGAKSRVQRGRKLLKDMLTDCCQIEFDRLGKVLSMECENCHER